MPPLPVLSVQSPLRVKNEISLRRNGSQLLSLRSPEKRKRDAQKNI